MMTSAEYIQLKAYSRQNGLLMGALWVVCFACFVSIVSNMTITLLFDLLILSVPTALVVMVRHYRDKVVKGSLSFRRGFAYGMLICMYATIITIFAIWIYFQYMDGGEFFAGMRSMFEGAEYKAMLKAYGVDPKQLTDIIAQMEATKPIEIALGFMSQSFTMSALLSLIVALVCKRSKRVA